MISQTGCQPAALLLGFSMSSHEQPQPFAPAKRSLGQNFLVDPNVSRKIVEALDLAPGDNVHEIGPARGALTEHILARTPGRYVALEKDEALASELERRNPLAEVVRGDAMRFDWASLASGERWQIVGNLPYNLASPLSWDIVSRAEFSQAVFMVQLEAGQRVAAGPGGKTYGALSAFVQNFATVEFLFKVPPQVFRPQPKVTSAVLRFFLRTPRPTGEEVSRLAATLRLCFQQRRKQLGTILKSKGIPDYVGVLRALDIDQMQRPETLAPERFLSMAKLLPIDFLA
jgi:16S rRNA (adenine1518-N6/adenine1519-N6)-dimethyltransferase